MAIARLLAVGLVSASLSFSSGQTGGLPTTKLIVTNTQTRWPDGSPVESGGLNYPGDIYVVDVNGKHIRNLTHDAPTNYVTGWLPSSRRILYESVPNDRMRSGRPRVFSIKPDGSQRRQLASGERKAFPARLLPVLSTDGHWISFARGRWPCWLSVMRSDGTHKTALAQTSFGYYDPPTYGPYDASWSPDGKRIAFVRGFAKYKAYGSGANPRSAIYVINIDGTGLHSLTPLRPKVETMNPVWSPDGSKIVFVEHSYALGADHDWTYVMRADGTHVKRLPQLDGSAVWFWLSPDRIAYGVYESRFHSIDADGKGKPQPLPGRIRMGRYIWVTSGQWASSTYESPARPKSARPQFRSTCRYQTSASAVLHSAGGPWFDPKCAH